MPALDNPRHEHFARLMATGTVSQSAAYAQTYPDSDPDSVRANCSRLTMENYGVTERIRELQSKTTVLTLSRKRELLSEMAEGKRPSKRVIIRGPDGETERLEHDHTGAIELDAKLAGELTGTQVGVQLILTPDQLRTFLPGEPGPVQDRTVQDQASPIIEIEGKAG